MGVKYKKTNTAPWITPSNNSSVNANAPDTVGPETRLRSILRTTSMRNKVFAKYTNL